MGKRAMMVWGLFLAEAFALGSALAAPVPDTGVTKCYDNSGEIPCPSLGERFYGQDANYAINPLSYTKLDSNGNALTNSAPQSVMDRGNWLASVYVLGSRNGLDSGKEMRVAFGAPEGWWITLSMGGSQ